MKDVAAAAVFGLECVPPPPLAHFHCTPLRGEKSEIGLIWRVVGIGFPLLILDKSTN